MQNYEILGNADGAVYQQLLDSGAVFACSAILVIRSTLGLEHEGRKFVSLLEPWCTGRNEASCWPGTRLLGGHTAEVLTYKLTPPFLVLLRNAADSIFAWTQPDLPEDLAFLRPDGNPYLTSITHEHYAGLSLTPNELERLGIGYPDLYNSLEAIKISH